MATPNHREMTRVGKLASGSFPCCILMLSLVWWELNAAK